MLPKNMSKGFVCAPSLKWWIETIYYVLDFYWPHFAIFMSKNSENLDRTSNEPLHANILYKILKLESFSNLLKKESHQNNEIWVWSQPKDWIFNS